jgi:hypothetical protein
VQQGEEAVNWNFLSLEDLQGSQSKSRSSISFCCQPDLQWMEQWMCCVCRAPVRVTYMYLEDDGTKVHMSTGGNASGSIIIPYCVILRETKTTSSSGSWTWYQGHDTQGDCLGEKTLDPTAGGNLNFPSFFFNEETAKQNCNFF